MMKEYAMQCKAVNGLSCGDDMWEWNWDDAGLVFLAFEFGQNFKGRVNKAKAPSRDPPFPQSLAATVFQQCPSSATYRRAILLLVLASSYQCTEVVEF
jgi:hypothetical protein